MPASLLLVQDLLSEGQEGVVVGTALPAHSRSDEATLLAERKLVVLSTKVQWGEV
jgi:hypothetical protein